jgi:DNA-binding MarR family transcriptional regulator
MQKSMEERLVLSVLRYANLTSPSVGAISRLTDLDNATVESLLERLTREGLCIRVSIDQNKRYRPVGLFERPLRSNC